MIDQTLEFIQTLLSTEHLADLAKFGGIPMLAFIVFAETGLLVGFFLPGDSMLVAAGVVSATITAPDGTPVLPIWWLNLILVAASFLGNSCGYWLGYKTGPSIFKRDDSLLFKKRHAEKAHAFYAKHGGQALVAAPFMPIFRTFVPFIAGVAKMDYHRFIRFNAIGSAAWITSMLWIGYTVGEQVGDKLHILILVVIFVSFLPMIITALRRYIASRAEKSA